MYNKSKEQNQNEKKIKLGSKVLPLSGRKQILVEVDSLYRNIRDKLLRERKVFAIFLNFSFARYFVLLYKIEAIKWTCSKTVANL